MFKLEKHQIQRFEHLAHDAFLERLVWLITTHDPGFLPRFPAAVRRRIAGNLAARAAAAGATWQSSIAAWARLMVSVAPNLGSDPAVRAWMAKTGNTPDHTISRIHKLLSTQDWERIRTRRCDLYLFTPPHADAWPLERKVAAALPLLLWDRVDAAQAASQALRAIGTAEQLGMGALEDAPLAIAVMRELYRNEPGLGSAAWVADIRNTELPPKVRLEMLRARTMLDHGRWS